MAAVAHASALRSDACSAHASRRIFSKKNRCAEPSLSGLFLPFSAVAREQGAHNSHSSMRDSPQQQLRRSERRSVKPKSASDYVTDIFTKAQRNGPTVRSIQLLKINKNSSSIYMRLAPHDLLAAIMMACPRESRIELTAITLALSLQVPDETTVVTQRKWRASRARHGHDDDTTHSGHAA